jgi:hypothetical protein
MVGHFVVLKEPAVQASFAQTFAPSHPAVKIVQAEELGIPEVFSTSWRSGV